jgi:uncharacterized membrane protein
MTENERIADEMLRISKMYAKGTISAEEYIKFIRHTLTNF